MLDSGCNLALRLQHVNTQPLQLKRMAKNMKQPEIYRTKGGLLRAWLPAKAYSIDEIKAILKVLNEQTTGVK